MERIDDYAEPDAEQRPKIWVPLDVLLRRAWESICEWIERRRGRRSHDNIGANALHDLGCFCPLFVPGVA